MNNHKPDKVTGLKHLFAAGSYSWAGIKRLLGETAARHELAFFAAIIIVYLATNAPLYGYLISTLLFLILICVEALNTAIEEIVDLVSPEWSLAAKNAKDLGSLAVLCLLLANGLFALVVIVMHIRAG